MSSTVQVCHFCHKPLLGASCSCAAGADEAWVMIENDPTDTLNTHDDSTETTDESSTSTDLTPENEATQEEVSTLLRVLKMNMHFRRSIIQKLLDEHLITISALDNGLLIINIDSNSLYSSQYQNEFNRFIRAIENSLIAYKLTHKTKKDYTAALHYDEKDNISSLSLDIKSPSLFQKLKQSLLNTRLVYQVNHLRKDEELENTYQSPKPLSTKLKPPNTPA